MIRIAVVAAVVSALPVAAAADDGASMKVLAAAAAAVPAVPAIRYGSDDLRSGELRLPAGRGPFPVAVVIHGGCWSTAFGSPADTRPLAAELTKRGFATWNIEYRRVGNSGGGWPGTFEDVGAAVDQVRDLARRYPLDLNNVILVGHSSGAHLALWAASRSKLADPIAGKAPLKIKAVVAIDGPGALAPFIGVDSQVCGAPAIVPLMGGTPAEKPEAYALATPAAHLPLGVHQLLVLGELGPMMKPYVSAATNAGDRVDSITPAGADHFNMLLPSTSMGSATADFIATTALK